MPTGYTAEIGEGNNVSFRDFALRCARAFGYLAEMREEPLDKEIPSEFRPDPYHKDQLEKAENELRRVRRMKIGEAKRLADEDYVNELEQNLSSSQERQQRAVRYGSMLEQVAKWQAPSPDHKNLRDYMIEQLQRSLVGDCGYVSSTPKRMTAASYKAQLIKNAKRYLKYHREQCEKEVEGAREKTEWVRALRESLPSE